MDDLERAILISFDESGTIDAVLKSQAVAYCQQIKENQSICRICVERLCISKVAQVQFWCLQCLYDILRVRYSSMSPEEKSFIRKSVFSIACFEAMDDTNSARILEGPAFVKNKLAQVLVSLVYLEYPVIWPSVFIDYLPHLSKSEMVIDMFCRVLNALDDELISLDYPRSPEEVTVAGRVKDAMRQQCMAQIVRAWYDIISAYRNSNPELCASVLDSMRRYVSWIDIGLVVNDAFIPLLFELILGDALLNQLRGAAVGCVLAVVAKRMDFQAKLALLQSLQISRVFGLVGEDSDYELVSELAALLTGYATEVLECSKRLNSEDSVGASLDLLNEVFPSLFYVVQRCEIDSTFSIVQFLSDYVATMKGVTPLRENQLHHLGQILEVIRAQIQYDPCYRDNLDTLDKIGREEEDRMVEFRKDFFVLLRNIGRVAPDVTQAFIRNSLARSVTTSSDRNVEEVEVALSLFLEYGESVGDEAMKIGSGLLGELVPMLLSTKFPCHSNRLVALSYLETAARYMKFVQYHTEYIPIALTAFLDERGIHHANINVSRRASYLFMKVVKLLKAMLVPFIEKILQSLQDKIAQFTTVKEITKDIGSEDGSHIFEAIGLLIGMETVPADKQTDFLSALLTPLCQQVEASLQIAKVQNSEGSPVKIANMQQIIMAINALSKGFNERLVTTIRPGIGVMFKQEHIVATFIPQRSILSTNRFIEASKPMELFKPKLPQLSHSHTLLNCMLDNGLEHGAPKFWKTLDVLLKILAVYPEVEPLRCKVRSFVHRMVDTLGKSVIPYLPKALEQLLSNEPKEMEAFLTLLNQLIRKFTTRFHDILVELYPGIAIRIFNILPRDVFPSGPGSNTEEIRELQDLQRTLFTFLHVITTHDFSSVFISPKSRAYLDPMMQMLLYTTCNHEDIHVRKICVQIFIRLIKDWCGWLHEEKVPGFQSFVIETFATNCCLYSVLDKTFEFGDANTLNLFGEIVSAQKIMYEKLGNDFLVHFVSKGFQTVHCPQDLAEQYCQKLQGNDIKGLGSFYRSLIETLRLQQNGSLVFR